MCNRIYLTILLGLMMISLASAIPIFKFGDSDTTTYTNVITQISNSTDKWDNLDTPSDITGHQYWYNQSTRFFSWLSSFDYNYNQTTQFSNWLSGFLFNYNQTILSIYNYNQTIASVYDYNMTINSIYDYNQTQTADTTYAYNQSSPYDNFNYNMTTASIYNYNMTINSIYDYNQTSLYDYNMTIYGIYNYNQTTAFIYNYNQSESIWHYNQTINSAYDYNMTIASIYDYNQTVAFIYNYNQSESIWHYNQTIYGEYNYNQTQTFTYDYNQSSPYDVYNYNMSDGNSGADGSYNSTYEIWAYNQTIEDTTYHYNQSSPYDVYNYNMTVGGSGGSSYNATYATWAYNMTSPFNTWLSSFLYNYNQTVYGIYNYNQTAPLMTYSYNQTAPAMTYEYNQTTPALAVVNQTCLGTNNYSYGYLNGKIQCRDNGLNGSAASGGATKEFFSTAMEGSVGLGVDGTWAGMLLTASGYAYYKFYIPNDFNSLSEATIMIIGDAEETIQWDIISSWGSVGESKTQNTDTQLDQTKAITANTIQELDISGVLDNGTLSAGDYVSIKFDSDTTQYREIGLRIKYT